MQAFEFPEVSLASARPSILELLKRAIDGVIKEIGGIEAGCLVSLLMEVPAGTLPETAVPGSEVYWRGPSQALVMQGRGQAIRFADDAAMKFECTRARWHLLSFSKRPGGIPRAFFTVPSAPAQATPTVWVPLILMQWFEGRLTIVLTARRDSNSPSSIAQRWLTEVELMLAPTAYGNPRPHSVQSVSAAPNEQQWTGRAGTAIKAIASGLFDKIVLARRLELQLAYSADAAGLTRKLAGEYPASCVFMLPHGNGRTIAASPEMLAVKRGRNIVCDALAGTAQRTPAASEDSKAIAALMSSAKERHEHAFVVDDIRASLAPICEKVAHASEPSVLRLKSLFHLQTKIHGRLRPGASLLDAVARIHPTAAVLGYPRPAAAAWLKDIGENRDGLYSGAAGWIDVNGDGEAAVVLRSAYIEGRTAVLWAGAGIVAQSEPAAELAETRLKLATMLEALGAA